MRLLGVPLVVVPDCGGGGHPQACGFAPVVAFEFNGFGGTNRWAACDQHVLDLLRELNYQPVTVHWLGDHPMSEQAAPS